MLMLMFPSFLIFFFLMNTIIRLNLIEELNILHIMYVHKSYPKN